MWQILQQAHERFGARLVHFSFQTNHVHLLKGPVVSDRYHSRVLRTPSEVKNSIAYVLNNDLRHTRSRTTPFDYFSSAPYFEGWAEGRVAWPKPLVGPPPCVPARSWLLFEGWRRAGSDVSLHKIPGPA